MQGNEQQKQAIVWNTGPALILAGPGSGKTFTTVERVRYLIGTHHVDPAAILVITFTKAAARQMRERFFKRMGEQFCPVTFGTFHAVFYHILQHSCHYGSHSILNEKEKREYLRRTLALMPGEVPKNADWEDGLLAEIGYIKNAGRLPQDFRSDFLEPGRFREAFIRFQRLIREAGRLDLDDFAAACLHLFCTRPDALKSWRQHFSYILVDEFQDINSIQYEVVKLLAGKENNLFAVGDDDQSIYGFRGADPSVMRRFAQDFPDAARITLPVNYRSRPGIVETAGKLVGHNRERFSKNIVSGRKDMHTKTVQGDDKSEKENGWKLLGGDGSIAVGSFESRREQMRALAGRITVLRRTNNLSIAAIFRTNTDAALLAEELGAAGIAFTMKEKVRNPYEHPVCRDLCAYLTFAARRGRSSFFRIMNRPCRYLSRQMATGETVSFSSLLAAAQGKPWLMEHILRMRTDIGRITGMDLYAAVNYVRKGIGYDGWLGKENQGDQLAQALEMADFFQDSVKNMKSCDELLSHMETFESQLKASEKTAGQAVENDTENVQLLTMHGSKGLEFDIVFLPDCNEGTVPHKKNMKGKELEEERRMFYVGMTRAKEKLYLSWVRGTRENPGFPSRFLGECGYKDAYRME